MFDGRYRAATAPVVLTVKVELPDVGLREQVGMGDPPPVTAQVRLTVPA